MSLTSRIMICLLLPAAALADDARVTRVEQDVRTLQRDLQVLGRQVDNLRLQSTRPSVDGTSQPPVLSIANPAWVDAAKWKQLRTGMSELEVIGTLGPPSSTRAADGTHELLYAVEIGPAAFLAGSVLMRNRAVVEIRVPVLK
jgi:hypothetical protein